jgi:hypothetical protein
VYNSNEGQELREKKETGQELEEEDGSKGEQCKMLTTPDFVIANLLTSIVVEQKLYRKQIVIYNT